jgi:hypothetical protein
LPLWYLQALLTLIKMTRLSPHSNTMTSRKSSPTENMPCKFAPFIYPGGELKAIVQCCINHVYSLIRQIKNSAIFTCPRIYIVIAKWLNEERDNL